MTVNVIPRPVAEVLTNAKERLYAFAAKYEGRLGQEAANELVGIACTIAVAADRLAPHVPAPEQIRNWVRREFNAQHVDKVTKDLVDVATGNRQGNTFEREALTKIFPEWKPPCES